MPRAAVVVIHTRGVDEDLSCRVHPPRPQPCCAGQQAGASLNLLCLLHCRQLMAVRRR